jgi:hypothetical protein
MAELACNRPFSEDEVVTDINRFKSLRTLPPEPLKVHRTPDANEQIASGCSRLKQD